MHYIYFGTVFAAMIVFLLSSLALFSQRKNGDRSRLVFGFINLLSVFNYINVISSFDDVPPPFTVMPVSYLLLGIVVISTYIMYPIEVISPGWLNWKRVFKIYTPAIFLIIFYKITQWQKVTYTPFKSIEQLITNIGSFEVLFRIMLILLIFLPAVLLYFVSYTRKYNNTNNHWMRCYVTIVIINDTVFLLVLSSESIIIRTLYYLVSVACSIYLVYQELFVRIIEQPNKELITEDNDKPEIKSILDTEINKNNNIPPYQISQIYIRLEKYINQTQAWRNPDLSVNELTTVLCTNRTYLREAIQKQGYEGYYAYINSKRIAEFIKIIERQGGGNYSQIFFEVGFRSKTTAFRNFRNFTGMVPSEYFQKSKLK